MRSFAVIPVLCILTACGSPPRSDVLPTTTLNPAGIDARGPVSRTPLMEAAMRGQLEEVKRLIDAGADLNAQDEQWLTPLMLAVMNHNGNIARFLIQSGAAIDMKDKSGETALQKAQVFYPDDLQLITVLRDPDSARRIETASKTSEPQSTPNLKAGDNLTDDELLEVDRIVLAEKARKGLTDRETLFLMQRETEKAARAKARRSVTK